MFIYTRDIYNIYECKKALFNYIFVEMNFVRKTYFFAILEIAFSPFKEVNNGLKVEIKSIQKCTLFRLTLSSSVIFKKAKKEFVYFFRKRVYLIKRIKLALRACTSA